MKKKYMRSKWLAMMIVVALITSLVPIYGTEVVKANGSSLFAGGSGTAENPYLISTMSQFNNIREVHQDNLHFKLMNDLTVSDFSTTWSRISSEETSQLNLDGNGHTIIMDVFNASHSREPLFDTLGVSSVIKNLKLMFFNNNPHNSSEYAPLAVNNEGEIVNVHVENDSSMDFSWNSQGYIRGDFAGLVLNNKSTGNIEYSSTNLDLQIVDQGSNTAGFVWNNEGSITHSVARSRLQGDGNAVGGFVGRNSGIIESSYADVDSNVTFQTKAAGFVVDNVQGGTISTSFSSGYISVQGLLNQSKHVGGFVASNEGRITQSYTLIGFYIYTFQFQPGDIKGYFGGFVASNGATGSIEEVYANSDQFSINNINTPDIQIWKGRLYGENNGTIERAYYRIQEGEVSDNEGTPLLYEDLSDANHFVDWDFDQLWEIRDNEPAFQQESVALEINQQFIRMNLGSQYQFTASERGLYPPFIEGTSSINWSVDDDDITVVNGLVTIGEETAEGDYILRAELADDPSIFSEVTFTVVHPKVLEIKVNSELTNLVQAAQGGEYTVAFNVITEGGASEAYTIELRDDEFITVSEDVSGLFDRVHIAEDAPEGTYTLDVVSQFDPTFVQEYQFEVVGPYRELVGLKQDGVLYTNQLLKHAVFGEQSYEVAYINHGNITSTPIIEISSTGGGIITPIQGVEFSNNKIVIAEELKETIAEEYGSIYLNVSLAEEPSVLTDYELTLSNANFNWEFNNGVAPSIYHLVGNYIISSISFYTMGIEKLGDEIALDVSSNHPEINTHGVFSYWDDYRQGYYVTFSVDIQDTVPSGDYTVTIVLNDSGLKQTIPVYVRDEIIKSISLDTDKIFIPKNRYQNWDTIRVPLNIEFAEGITNFDYAQLNLSTYGYNQSGSPYYGNLPHISSTTEDDQTYLEFSSNSNIYNLPLGSIFDVKAGFNLLPDELLDFQVVFGDIDRIDIEGIDENNPALYIFEGESITLNATVVSENHTIEGFPIPQDINWSLTGQSMGAALDQNGVFTLNQRRYTHYYVNAAAKGGFVKNNIMIVSAVVESVEPAAERINIRAGEAADFEVKVRTNHAEFYSTTEFTVESDNVGIAYVDGQMIVDENVEPGSYEMTFTSTRDTTKTATIMVQVGGPTDVEVQPELIKVMPGETAELTAEFVGSGEFTQDGVWDTHGETGLSVTSISDGQYQVSVASNVQPGNYTITYSHEEFSAVSKDVTVQVYDITGITGVENVYHLNQGQELTLNPAVVTVNGDDVEGIDEFSITSSNQAAVAVNSSGKIVVDPDATTGKYTLTITSDHKNSVTKTIELYVTSIDSVTVSLPIDSEPAYQIGDSLQLTAEVEVTGQVSDEVIWSSSNDAMVSVDEDGLVTVKAGAETGNYTITATSVIDDRSSGYVTIEVGKVTGINLDKETVNLQAGEEIAITASAEVIGQLSTAVEWSSASQEVQVNAQGEVTVAPATEPGTYVLTVQSAINEQISKSVTVEVFAIEDIEIEAIPSIYKGKSHALDFDVEITGESGDRAINVVSWSANHAGITVDEDGFIQVAASVPAGTYVLTGTSTLNPSVTREAEVKVTSIDAVRIEEVSKSVLQAGESITLTVDVSVSGDVSNGVVWSVSGPSQLVTINNQGELTVVEDAVTGNYVVTATSTVDEGVSDSVTIAVAEVTGVVVEQDKVALRPGQTATITASATVGGALSTEVDWSSLDENWVTVVDGAITVATNAPAANYEIMVSSKANPDVYELITIQVYQIVALELSKDEFTLNQGQFETFSYVVQKENATDVDGVDEVSYSMENNDVYVDEDGNIVVGDDVEAGTYTITIQSALNQAVSDEIKVHVTSIDTVNTSVTQLQLYPGEQAEVTFTVEVSGDVSDEIIWESSHESIEVVVLGQDELEGSEEEEDEQQGNAQGEQEDNQEAGNEGKPVTIKVAANAVPGTYTVKAISTVDERKFAEIQVKVVRRPSSNPDPMPLPTDEEEELEEETPEETPPTENGVQGVFKSELLDVDVLIEQLEQLLSAGTELPQFADTKGHWASEAITKGAQLGIVSGYQDGSFKPNASVTRAEFIKMLANVFSLKAASDVTSFNDVNEHWAKQDIEIFASLGIVNGYGNGNFEPNRTITREEMVLIVSRVVNMDALSKDKAKGQFADLDEVSGYAQQVVVDAAQAGIINGKANQQFDPKAEASRAEALTIIFNMLSLDRNVAALLK